eukprot:c13512_g1_i1 orf=117-1913(+)
MNGGTTLIKHPAIPCDDPLLPLHKRAWSHTSPPPPASIMATSFSRFLIICLLSTQVLVLLLIGVAPAYVKWVTPAAWSPTSVTPLEAASTSVFPVGEEALLVHDSYAPFSPNQDYVPDNAFPNPTATLPASPFVADSSKRAPSLDSEIPILRPVPGSPVPGFIDISPAAYSSVDGVTKEYPVGSVKSTEKHSTTADFTSQASPLDASSRCEFGRIYVYNLPSVFNSDLIANCSSLNPWNNICGSLAKDGLGETLGDSSPLGQEGSWYATDQFTSEIIFHRRMLQHPCVTDNPDLASAFYVPFYAGLDVGRFLWLESSPEQRDFLARRLLQWLDTKYYWKRNGGWDHFLMVGRITWDFRRSRDLDWGSSFFYIPPMLNTTRLLIERNPWDGNEMAVPYPTSFHPKSDPDLKRWQDYLRNRPRKFLFSFAGAPRKQFVDDFRLILLNQCRQAESCSSLDCSAKRCEGSHNAMNLFLDSTFCLQPRGDSFTRRSIFDCLIAGSIPVFFWHQSAHWQYRWHLPADESSYSVFISKADMMNGTIIEQVLKSLPEEKVERMRDTVITALPHFIYAESAGSLTTTNDAFDIAVEGVLRKFKSGKT